MGKPIYELDGSRFSTLEEFNDEISRVIIPNASWGRNLNAFNDILRGGFGTPEGGFVIRWHNSPVSRERLGYPEKVRHLEELLRRCHPSNRAGFAADLELAKRGQGETIFQWLLAIIAVHGKGGAEEGDGVELILD
jgi:RNAse (barnase) inhibitor barstar